MTLLSIKSTCAKRLVSSDAFKYKTIVQLVAAKVSSDAFKYKVIVARNHRGGGKGFAAALRGGGVQQHHYLFTRGYALLLHHLEDLLLVVGVVQALVVEVFVVSEFLLLLLPVLPATRCVLVLLHVRAHFIGLVLLPLALRHCWIGGLERSKGPDTNTLGYALVAELGFITQQYLTNRLYGA